jgi:hypothetical protein
MPCRTRTAVVRSATINSPSWRLCVRPEWPLTPGAVCSLNWSPAEIRYRPPLIRGTVGRGARSSSGVISSSPEEVLMSLFYCPATLFGLVISVGGLIVAPARAYPTGLFFDCGAGLDLCVQACDYSVPGGTALGKCNGYCSQGAGICEASRIPRPAGYRSRVRIQAGRK